MPEPSRRWIRKLADWVDHLLHSRRRDRARARMRALGRPLSVLFVCHGNICRSPYAEHAFARRAGLTDGDDQIRVASAGFIGPGRESPPEAVEVARQRGLDLGSHRASPLDPGTVRDSGLIVVMEDRQRRQLRELHGAGPWEVLVLGDLDPQPIRWRRIQDPFGRDASFFAEVYERIDRCVGVLVQDLGRAGSSRT